jgi:hypothetical protein
MRQFDVPAHKKLVLDTYSRTSQPILVGPVSLLRGWKASLADTETLLEDMVSEGTLRRITASEKKTFGVQGGYLPV